jgi:hypothetical protein
VTIGFGNSADNLFTVTNNDGYSEYRGLSGNDTYNVNTNLTDDLIIRDGDGSDTVVLGEAAIEATRFFTGGVEFTYETGGKLTVLGDMDSFSFVFGGGTDPFEPATGGTPNSFQETTEAFGLDFAQLGSSPTEGDGGVIRADGSVSGSSDVIMMDGETYTATEDVDIFVYGFGVFSGGGYGEDDVMAGLTGSVAIDGFDPDQDIIRFAIEGDAPTNAEFEAGGYMVMPNAFEGETYVSLEPYRGESGEIAAVASDIMLLGVNVNDINYEIVSV